MLYEASRVRLSAEKYRHALRVLEALLAALPGDVEIAREIASNEPEMAAVLTVARAHGLEGVLVEHRIPLPCVADSVRRDAGRRYGLALMQSERHGEVLAGMLDALETAGVRATPLKGLYLAERLYPTLAARATTDFDVMVADSDLTRAAIVLEGLGFSGDKTLLETYLRSHGHHLHFSKARSPVVELHFRAHSRFGSPLASEALLERAERRPSRLGCDIWTLRPEDEFYYLALHAAGHSFARLAWLYDLKLLRERHSDIDFMALLARAARDGSENALRAALMQLSRVGVTLSNAVQLGDVDSVRRASLNGMLARIEATEATPRVQRAAVPHLLVQALLCDRWETSAEYMRHHLFRVAKRTIRASFPRVTPKKWAA